MSTVMDAVKASIEELRRRFPGKSRSWLMRSLRRFLNNDIRKLNENVWVVAGHVKWVTHYHNTWLGT